MSCESGSHEFVSCRIHQNLLLFSSGLQVVITTSVEGLNTLIDFCSTDAELVGLLTDLPARDKPQPE